ncbi:unnamed protein product [Paramecium pentaurelia]|uniref:Uncharacterized protein n=1 Tax=Paramecium pentaurelia TaxID=43138 RepID=A0A8S1XFG3_9CILI|nr:unnamed protein product [Paramecium pentaurelia]
MKRCQSSITINNHSQKQTIKLKSTSQYYLNPCLQPLQQTLKKYQNFSLIYLNKKDFFYPYCHKRLTLFGNSNNSSIQNLNKENNLILSKNKPYIPPLLLKNNFSNCQKISNQYNTDRIYKKLTHRSIKSLLTESNYSKYTSRQLQQN